jgi:hypothetical protein
MIYYYLVRPNSDLQALLAQNPRISILPTILFAEERGRPILTVDESIEIRKLFYIASLYNHMRSLKDPILEGLNHLITPEERDLQSQFYQKILGEPPYNRQLFDRWWTIEEIYHMSSYNETFKLLPLDALEVLEETESPRLAAWLERSIHWKKDDLKKNKPK